MASIISAKELRQHFGEIADRIEKGEEFIVLKRSKPLFRMIPINKAEQQRGVC
jgi:prevent-host-death family protein